MSDIYQPAEDSYLLSETLKKLVKNKDSKALDMGSGSGIQAKTIIELGIKPENITLADINKEAIKHLKKEFPKSEVIRSDLFSKINAKSKFDIVVFNPPYLPESKHDKEKDTAGGKKGDETALRFLKQLKKYLTKKGKCYLLLSSFTPMKNIKQEFKSYKTKILSHKKLFFEELFVYEICLKK